MTDDRELLELAAKAAGIGPLWYCDGRDVAYYGEIPHHRTFKPLTDDGDALRLAVKLSMSIVFGANYVIVNSSVQSPTVNNANDPYAATRRAIVRAAAEIGRSLP
jgi:hypothetical protein